MHETEADLRELQELLDRSHAGAGPHLRAIVDEDRRIPAAELPALLPGVQVLALATVTALGGRRVSGRVSDGGVCSPLGVGRAGVRRPLGSGRAVAAPADRALRAG